MNCAVFFGLLFRLHEGVIRKYTSPGMLKSSARRPYSCPWHQFHVSGSFGLLISSVRGQGAWIVFLLNAAEITFCCMNFAALRAVTTCWNSFHQSHGRTSNSSRLRHWRARLGFLGEREKGAVARVQRPRRPALPRSAAVQLRHRQARQHDPQRGRP